MAVAEVWKASQREMFRKDLWQSQSMQSLQKNGSMFYLSVGCSAVSFNYFVCHTLAHVEQDKVLHFDNLSNSSSKKVHEN